jgi:hypothetical protein
MTSKVPGKRDVRCLGYVIESPQPGNLALLTFLSSSFKFGVTGCFIIA